MDVCEIIKKIKEIVRLWNTLSESYSEAMSGVDEQHRRNTNVVYYYLNEKISTVCNDATVLMQVMIGDININAEKRQLDINAVVDLTHTLQNLLMCIILNDIPIVKVNNEEIFFPKNRVAKRSKIAKKASGKDVYGYRTCSKLLVDEKGCSTDATTISGKTEIALGLIASSFAFSFILGFCYFINYFVIKHWTGFQKRWNLKNLAAVMEGMLNLMIDLESKPAKFQNYIQEAARIEIKKTIKLIDKISGLIFKRHQTKKIYNARVKALAASLNQDIQEVLKIFQGLVDLTKKNECLLKNHICKTDPLALNKHKK